MENRHWELGIIPNNARYLRRKRDIEVADALCTPSYWKTKELARDEVCRLNADIVKEIMSDVENKIDPANEIRELCLEAKLLNEIVYKAISYVHALEDRLAVEASTSIQLADLIIQKLGPMHLPALMTSSDPHIRLLLMNRYQVSKEKRAD